MLPAGTRKPGAAVSVMWQLKKEIDARHPGANQLQLKKSCCWYRNPGS
ncbi:hypothetical protein [Bacillus cabrialesii]|nr:hypothetical protein [Bacillus cabrialesii]MBU2661813.1 hypothetical protein [Bacillus cabrialesii]